MADAVAGPQPRRFAQDVFNGRREEGAGAREGDGGSETETETESAIPGQLRGPEPGMSHQYGVQQGVGLMLREK